jgi:hypothetical protein
MERPQREKDAIQCGLSFPGKVGKMTTDTMYAVFADFNDQRAEPPPLPVAEESPALDNTDQLREEAWTEGYLTGHKASGEQNGEGRLAAKLLTSLDDLAAKTDEAVDAASLAVADLLISTVIAAVSDDWPAKLLGRARMIAERVKPALAVAPEFVLRDDGGIERRFGDISSLSRALDEGIVGEDVTIRWQRGEATISREALLEDLRAAVIPLSAGLVIEQNPRHPS